MNQPAPAPTPEETARWQRRLAAQANNRAWRLSEQTSRTDAEDEEMLHAAHAAMHLWSIVGNENNHAHAEQLLAHVHALRHDPARASAYAKRPGGYFLGEGREAWEVAMTHCVLANVAAACGDPAAHALHYQQASECIEALPNPEDRAILLASFRVVPVPPAASAQ